jgi:hypothetical protein
MPPGKEGKKTGVKRLDSKRKRQQFGAAPENVAQATSYGAVQVVNSSAGDTV